MLSPRSNKSFQKYHTHKKSMARNTIFSGLICGMHTVVFAWGEGQELAGDVKGKCYKAIDAHDHRFLQKKGKGMYKEIYKQIYKRT